MYLEDSLIEPARRDLESVVATVIKGPSSTNSETHFGSSFEHFTHKVSTVFIHSMVHEPIRVPPIHIQSLTVHHELSSVPFHKPYLRSPLVIQPQVPEWEVDESCTYQEPKNWYRWPVPCRNHAWETSTQDWRSQLLSVEPSIRKSFVLSLPWMNSNESKLMKPKWKIISLYQNTKIWKALPLEKCELDWKIVYPLRQIYVFCI